MAFEWQSPKAFSLWLSQATLSEGKGKFLRTSLLLLLILAFLYFGLQPLPWHLAGVNFNKLFNIMTLLSLGMSLLLYVVQPYLLRFSCSRYRVDSKGITRNAKLFRWKTILHVEWLSPDKQPPNVLAISFRVKSCRRSQSLVFDSSQEDLAHGVYAYIQGHIPEQGGVASKPLLLLTSNQHWYMLAFSLCAAIILDAVVLPWAFQRVSKENAGFIPILLLLAGPGTWGILTLYGHKLLQYKGGFLWALLYNYFTFFLMMIIRAIIIVHRLREVFR